MAFKKRGVQGDDMKIFMSWSGLLSKHVAKVVKCWLLDTVFPGQSLEIFISEEDIEIGSDWLKRIKLELLTADLAVVFLTKENINSPWLNFECGGIATGKEERKVVPFLVNISNSDLKTPLKHFQSVSLAQDRVHKLLADIIGLGNITSPSLPHLNRMLPDFYSELNNKISTLLKQFPNTYREDEFVIYPKAVRYLIKGKVFVGVPMASVDPNEYKTYREHAVRIKKALKKFDGIKDVYCPCENIKDVGCFDGIEKAIHDDFRILKESEHYIFMYPKKITSSILLEMGYAIALSKKTTIFAKNLKDLPYMLERADKAISNIRIYLYNTIEDIENIINSNGMAFLERDE